MTTKKMTIAIYTIADLKVMVTRTIEVIAEIASKVKMAISIEAEIEMAKSPTISMDSQGTQPQNSKQQYPAKDQIHLQKSPD